MKGVRRIFIPFFGIATILTVAEILVWSSGAGQAIGGLFFGTCDYPYLGCQ
jgi:hypothetical protein